MKEIVANDMMMKAIIIVGIICGIIISVLLIIKLIKFIKSRPLPMDELEGHDFEYYCADILKDHGF